MNKEVRNNGFSPEKEENFLKRLPFNLRRENLGQELKTQLAEDFGVVEFTIKYRFNGDGKIVDLKSGDEIVKLTSRGKIEEETESIKKIEYGLKSNPGQTWISFSPKNEELGYPKNCVDFWRVVDGEVVWNRIVVKNNFDELNRTRSFLSGEEKVKDKWEILRSPIAIDHLKLAEIFDFFILNESENFNDLSYIERVVDKYLNEFGYDFGEKLTENKDLIFRLYSACFNALKYRENNEKVVISRYDLESYMYGIMNEVRIEKSGGCAATTTIGIFGEKIGYYVLSNGEVVKGEIPKGYKECKKCGCWYEGEKCPFC